MTLTNSTYLFGATSLVGWNLYRTAPDSIVPFCNRNTKIAACKSWQRLNIEDRNKLESILKPDSPSHLIHCAGVCDVEKCETSPEWSRSINIDSVSSLLEFLPKTTRLIYCSSDHVFGGDGIYTESSESCPISVYGESKFRAEQLIRRERPDSLIIRIGLPIGSSIDGRSGHFDWLRYRSRKKLPVTIVRGENRSVVRMQDLAPRILALTESRVTGTRHITAVRTVSRVDLANYLMQKHEIGGGYNLVDRTELSAPHLGSVELQSDFSDAWAKPLRSVID